MRANGQPETGEKFQGLIFLTNFRGAFFCWQSGFLFRKCLLLPMMVGEHLVVIISHWAPIFLFPLHLFPRGWGSCKVRKSCKRGIHGPWKDIKEKTCLVQKLSESLWKFKLGSNEICPSNHTWIGTVTYGNFSLKTVGDSEFFPVFSKCISLPALHSNNNYFQKCTSIYCLFKSIRYSKAMNIL